MTGREALALLGETESLKVVDGACLEVMVDIALGYCISKVLRVARFHVCFFYIFSKLFITFKNKALM